MIKFGTGGWRAIIADEFTKENIRLVVAGLCKLMLLEGHAGKEICVGYDRRFLSKESAHWAAEVLAGYGFHVFVVARSSPTLGSTSPARIFSARSANALTISSCMGLGLITSVWKLALGTGSCSISAV